MKAVDVLPHPHIPSLDLGIFSIHPFGVLVGTGIILGIWLCGRRADKLGLDEIVISDVSLWAIIPGFVGAHWFELIFYKPYRIIEDPLSILKVWDGISSFGGFIGAALGTIFYMRRNKVPFWPYADSIAYGFVVAWIFGRMGCTIAYDHPGSLTDFFLAMPYSGGEVSHGVRHNLGFYEVLFAAALFGSFYLQRLKPRFSGWYVTTALLAYMPFRFALDFMRAADKRYFGLTGGQFAAIVFFGLALWALSRRAKVGEILVVDGNVHVFPDGRPALKKQPNSPSKGKGKKGKR